jgi:AbrB family looped-hinge helix DNA binding protein
MEPTKSKVWRNWQILLPPELCERLALKPGDYLKFADQEDKVVVEKIRA